MRESASEIACRSAEDACYNWQSGSFSNISMNYRCCHLVPHLRAISVQLREVFVMVTKLKELLSVDFQ